VQEESFMRGRIDLIVPLLAMGLSTGGALGQSPGSNQTQGVPMSGGAPQPDTSRIQQEMAVAHPAAGPLRITFGKKSGEWTPATLASLPHKTITVFNEHAKANQTYSGVPLFDMLKLLGVPDKPHGKDLRLYLVAEGSDGYGAVYSVAEVNPDVHDGTVIVADAIDGKAIGDEGPLKLVATGEKHPARWVRNLVAVKVMTAQ
jgi:hypothetical protein